MSVKGLEPDEGWLKRSAVGVLKVFASVSKVNQSLTDRCISFSTLYFGDKSIVWVFKSESVRDRFTTNRNLWSNCLSSMVRSCDSATPQSRLCWISCVGVPLTWWSESFFMRLGWIIGEPLLVKDNIRLRRSLIGVEF
ncbi:hypothetical protein Ddye_024381 [Dipteronia dyeriana]|uniref:DUF4283 domain-containing protein n=1 Tax=Dipteronia dyeriana TaxID=168575 RepID=A0AAD9WU44_9ROSI|nr:hypothetical protein Ddye_024381 [Dipteronia dyeriana]